MLEINTTRNCDHVGTSYEYKENIPINSKLNHDDNEINKLRMKNKKYYKKIDSEIDKEIDKAIKLAEIAKFPVKNDLFLNVTQE